MHPGNHDPASASPHAMDPQFEPATGSEDPFTNATNFDMRRVLIWSLVVVGVAAFVLAAIT